MNILILHKCKYNRQVLDSGREAEIDTYIQYVTNKQIATQMNALPIS